MRSGARIAIAVVLVCVAIVWGFLPIFIPGGRLLSLRLERLGPGTACITSWGRCTTFVVTLQNVGPWPMRVEYASWEFHPHARFRMGMESVSTFFLAPLGAYSFAVDTYGGDVSYLTFSGIVTILYKTDRVTVNSVLGGFQ